MNPRYQGPCERSFTADESMSLVLKGYVNFTSSADVSIWTSLRCLKVERGHVDPKRKILAQCVQQALETLDFKKSQSQLAVRTRGALKNSTFAFRWAEKIRHQESVLIG